MAERWKKRKKKKKKIGPKIIQIIKKTREERK